MIVLGIDPGLATFGLAVVRLAADRLVVERLTVLRTQHEERFKGELVSACHLRRVRELDEALLEQLEPWGTPAVICAEALSYPTTPRKGGRQCKACGYDSRRSQNPRAVVHLGMAWGLIAAIANDGEVPVAQCSTHAIKIATTGGRKASKADVRHGLEARFGDHVFAGLNRGDVEHAADALAAVVTCKDHPAMLTARRRAIERTG